MKSGYSDAGAMDNAEGNIVAIPDGGAPKASWNLRSKLLGNTMAGLGNDVFGADKGSAGGRSSVFPATPVASGPKTPAQGGIAGTYDPNYQTMADFGNDVFIGNKCAVGGDVPPVDTYVLLINFIGVIHSTVKEDFMNCSRRNEKIPFYGELILFLAFVSHENDIQPATSLMPVIGLLYCQNTAANRLHFIGIGDDDNFKIPNYEGEVTRYSQIGHQTNCCICFPRQLDIVKKFHIMVIRFTSNVTDPPVMLYMGVDKWGWPEDIWFHVDKVSSAHVYARLPPGQTINDMPESLIEDCAQLVKANSIQIRVAKRMNDIVNRLNKTEVRLDIDYRVEKEERDAKERQVKVIYLFVLEVRAFSGLS
ncbi:Coiled-coil domain-containing protein 25 [Dirofilaria immitis]|nr:Coiled-coil domain-containing protein 25 [Dirofilaria immitis]